MKKASDESREMRNEYDFSSSVANKYAAALKKQEHCVVLAPDVFEVFDTSEKVNNALRAIISAKSATPPSASAY